MYEAASYDVVEVAIIYIVHIILYLGVIVS